MLFDKKDNTYNADKTFDYFTIKSMVIQSLEKIVREELNRHMASINLHKIIDIQQEDKEDVVIANTGNNLSDDQTETKLSAPILKLKIRNTT
jgi:hypothetical protein